MGKLEPLATRKIAKKKTDTKRNPRNFPGNIWKTTKKKPRTNPKNVSMPTLQKTKSKLSKTAEAKKRSVASKKGWVTRRKNALKKK